MVGWVGGGAQCKSHAELGSPLGIACRHGAGRDRVDHTEICRYQAVNAGGASMRACLSMSVHRKLKEIRCEQELSSWGVSTAY